MTQPSTLFDRIDQAAKLSRQLTGKAAARTISDAFVTERIADIKALHQSGVPLTRYARLVAPVLGVRPSALLAAVRRAGLIGCGDSAVAPVTAPAPAPVPATKKPKPEPTASRSAPALAPVKVSAAPPGNPLWELPPWADGSDKRADESDEDYRLRKEIEGPPEASRKFIGPHNT